MARSVRNQTAPNSALQDALGELAVTVGNLFFSEPGSEEAYHASQTPAALRKATRGQTMPRPLREWEMEAGGSLALLSSPVKDTLLLMAEHPDFQAMVAVVYDPYTDEPASTNIIAFEGDAKKARKIVRAWLEELDDASFDENLCDLSPQDHDDVFRDFLEGLRDELFLPLRDNAAQRLTAIATRAAARSRRDGGFQFSNADMEYLYKYPVALTLALECYIGACRAEPRDEHLLPAWQQMILVLLGRVQPHHAGKEGWAVKLIDAYEDRILTLAREKTISSDAWYFLPSSFTRTRIVLSDDSKKAFGAAGAALAPVDAETDLPAAMRKLVDQLSSEVGGPFAMAEIITEVAGPLPVEVRAFLVHELGLAPHKTARDAVPLLLLDEAPLIRKAAASVLEQTAVPDTLSPDALRRVITARNWLPADERPALDRVIRKAREKGVPIAPWPKAVPVEVVATLIDGVSAQSVLVYSPTGRSGLFAMALLKRAVREVSYVPDEKRGNIKGHVKFIMENAEGGVVDRSYLDTAIQHAIATGLADGIVPPFGLLQIAESIGAPDWRDRVLDVPAEIDALWNGLAPADRTQDAIAMSLRHSNTWVGYDDVFGSWFKDVSDIPGVIAKAPRRGAQATIQFILDEVFEQLRGRWAENLLLLALCARAAKERTQQRRWKDFLVLAHELSSGRDLAEIPLMVTAARTTLRTL